MKARQQPDKVRTDGLAPTLETRHNKLDQPLAWRYCNVSVVAVSSRRQYFATTALGHR